MCVCVGRYISYHVTASIFRIVSSVIFKEHLEKITLAEFSH